MIICICTRHCNQMEFKNISSFVLLGRFSHRQNHRYQTENKDKETIFLPLFKHD